MNQGLANRGTGGFLHLANVARRADGNWLVGGKVLEENKGYRVVMSDFFLTGKEANLGFLTPQQVG